MNYLSDRLNHWSKAKTKNEKRVPNSYEYFKCLLNLKATGDVSHYRWTVQTDGVLRGRVCHQQDYIVWLIKYKKNILNIFDLRQKLKTVLHILWEADGFPWNMTSFANASKTGLLVFYPLHSPLCFSSLTTYNKVPN